MEFFEVIAKRRSIRRFTETPFPEEFIERALSAALLAPNSSNVQTWDFHWINTAEAKRKVVHACINQSAARTASQIVVISADPGKWRRSHGPLIKYVNEAKAPKMVLDYYGKLVPFVYRWGIFNSIAPVKFLVSAAMFHKPYARGPFTRRGLQEVAIKSAALAAENFVLAITAQGGATCMMEGFDEWRMRRILKLKSSARVVMAIAIGYEASERATWGPQFRLPLEDVVTKY